MKFKSRLGIRVAEQKVFQAEQQMLRKKFKVDADGIIKIEKKPLTEVIIQYGGYMLRAVTIIILFVLVATGILSLAYMYIAPEVPLKDILYELTEQFKGVV